MTSNILIKVKTILLLLAILPYLNSCGIYRPTDAREFPPEPEKRIQKNMDEGRGIRIFGGKKKEGFLILLHQIHYGEPPWTL